MRMHPLIELAGRLPDGVWPYDAIEYATELRQLHHEPNEENLQHVVLSEVRQLFGNQRFELESELWILSVLPCAIKGIKTWAICPVQVTRHLIERWHQRGGGQLNSLVSRLATPVPAELDLIKRAGLSWDAVTSVLLERTEFPHHRINNQPPDLVIRDEHGVFILQKILDHGTMEGYAAVTYVLL